MSLFGDGDFFTPSGRKRTKRVTKEPEVKAIPVADTISIETPFLVDAPSQKPTTGYNPVRATALRTLLTNQDPNDHEWWFSVLYDPDVTFLKERLGNPGAHIKEFSEWAGVGTGNVKRWIDG